MQTELNMRYFVDAKPGIVSRTQPDVENINYWDGNDQSPKLRGRTGFHKITGKVVITPFKKEHYYCGSWNYILPNHNWCGKKLDKGVEIYTLRFVLNRHSRMMRTERWCKDCWDKYRDHLMNLKQQQELYDLEQEKREWEIMKALQYDSGQNKRTMSGKYNLDENEAEERRKQTVYFNVYKGRANRFLDQISTNYTDKLYASLVTCHNKLQEIFNQVDSQLGGAPDEWITFMEWLTNELAQYTNTGDNGEA